MYKYFYENAYTTGLINSHHYDVRFSMRRSLNKLVYFTLLEL